MSKDERHIDVDFIKRCHHRHKEFLRMSLKPDEALSPVRFRGIESQAFYCPSVHSTSYLQCITLINSKLNLLAVVSQSHQS